MSSTKTNNKLLKTLLTSNIVSCGCGKPKLSDVYEPTRKSKTLITHNNPPIPQRHSFSSSCDKNAMSFDGDHECTTTTTVSFNNSSSSIYSPSEPETTNPKNTENNSSPNCGKIRDSIAVEKESDDPYLDFRNSMLQMIVEKRIYSKEDLEELLGCFLELNSASHHGVIIQAFTQIWNDLIKEKGKDQSCDTQR